MRPRLVLADSQAVLAEALACLLEPDFEVVGVATDGAELITQATRLTPALVVTDVSLPRLSGLAAGGRLARTLPDTRVVFLTACEDVEVAAEAFRLGASGYVLRSTSGQELVRALRAALRGGRWLSAALAGGDLAALPAPAPGSGPLGRLSPRKREVVRLLAEGHSMKETAAVLGISARTVAYHKYQAMETLSVRSSAQLVRFAVESRLIGAGGV
jgi:DNA-binding NarL/FixJ family response regulator